MGFIQFQPSEFAKISIILYVSHILVKYRSGEENTLKFFDGYNKKIQKLEMDNYIDNTKYNLPLIENIKNIKDNMIKEIDTVYDKLDTYNIIN